MTSKMINLQFLSKISANDDTFVQSMVVAVSLLEQITFEH